MPNWRFPFPTDSAVAPLRAADPHAGLRVKRGDVVVVGEPGEPWWIGDVIAVRGEARDPSVPDFLQVGNVDPPWQVVWVCAGSVVAVMKSCSMGQL